MSKTAEEIGKKKGIRGWFEARISKDLWKGISVVLAAAILSELSTIIRSESSTSSTGGGTSIGSGIVYDPCLRKLMASAMG